LVLTSHDGHIYLRSATDRSARVILDDASVVVLERLSDEELEELTPGTLVTVSLDDYANVDGYDLRGPSVRLGGLRVVHATDADHDTLIVRGELDIAAGDALRVRIEAACRAADRLMVDLSGVEYIDSTGLSQLVWAHSEAAIRGWTITFIRPSEHVRLYLERTGLDDVLPVV
jgi:anti-sigma B factor antagonist